MKKWIAVILVLILSLSLWACGKDDSKADPPATDPTTAGGNQGGGSGNFDLLKEIAVEIHQGESSITSLLVMTYDSDHHLLGYKSYQNDLIFSEVTFCPNGLLVQRQINYATNGTVVSTTTSTYDENGNELSYTAVDGDGQVQYTCTNTYTAQGLLETSTDSYGWHTYTYDDHGNLLTYRCGSGDEVWSNENYENIYQNGYLVEAKCFSDGELSSVTRYDEQGNVLAEINCSDEGREVFRVEYTYENGKLVKETHKTEGRESYRKENIYNDAGQLVEIRSTNISEEDTYESNTLITYENGNLSSIKEYDAGQLEAAYEFRYEKADVSEDVAQLMKQLYEGLLTDTGEY